MPSRYLAWLMCMAKEGVSLDKALCTRVLACLSSARSVCGSKLGRVNSGRF